MPGSITVVKRLDAQTVADQMKLPFLAVPQGKSEHPDKARHGRMQAPALDSRQHHFCIGMSIPALVAQFGPDFFEVVNLTIKNNHVAARGRSHGLMPLGGEVDNREAPECQPYTACIVKRP